MKKNRFLILAVALALSVFCLILRNYPNQLPVVAPAVYQKSTLFPSSSLAFVSRVIDGDTIQIDTGEKVRYIGMNTPETVDPRKPVECFGKEASAYNKNLVLNKKVKLVKDISDKDKYGRLLRYVYLEDGTFVNLKLVSYGYAYADTVPPNVVHASDFVKAQNQARQANLGLWQKCK